MNSRCNQSVAKTIYRWRTSTLSVLLSLTAGITGTYALPALSQSNEALPYSKQARDLDTDADAQAKQDPGPNFDNGNAALFDPERRRRMRQHMREMRGPSAGPADNTKNSEGEPFGRHMGGRMGMGGPMGGGHRQLDLTPLNLTDKQKEEIQKARQNAREQSQQLKQKMRQRMQEMHTLLFSPDASEQQIRAAHQQLRQTQSQLEEIGFNDLLHIRRVLTAEQRKKLPEIAPPEPPRGGFGQRGGSRNGGQRGGPPVVGENGPDGN